jgi:phage host-nuclease inhibitor protein Gam
MAKKTKTLGANMPVPQSQIDAAESLRVIGELQRQIARAEADMNDVIAVAKEQAEGLCAPLQAQIVERTQGLKVWAEANRAALTDGGKTKTADLGTGKVSWRLRPASVRLSKLDQVVEAIKKLGFGQFLRTKVEVNKEAMLADPEKARLINGVSIGSEGEDFIVEPFEAAISGVAA